MARDVIKRITLDLKNKPYLASVFVDKDRIDKSTQLIVPSEFQASVISDGKVLCEFASQSDETAIDLVAKLKENGVSFDGIKSRQVQIKYVSTAKEVCSVWGIGKPKCNGKLLLKISSVAMLEDFPTVNFNMHDTTVDGIRQVALYGFLAEKGNAVGLSVALRDVFLPVIQDVASNRLDENSTKDETKKAIQDAISNFVDSNGYFDKYGIQSVEVLTNN